MLQRTLPAGFIAPCLPTKTDKLPSGDGWLHEIKHDGFRIESHHPFDLKSSPLSRDCFVKKNPDNCRAWDANF
jgi:hypothetical protein